MGEDIAHAEQVRGTAIVVVKSEVYIPLCLILLLAGAILEEFKFLVWERGGRNGRAWICLVMAAV